MADSYTQVAPDSTGAKIQTTTKTVNAQTVHRQVVSTMSMRTRAAYYRADSGVLNVSLAAQAATAGFFWLINPVGSSVAVALKAMWLNYTTSAATVQLNNPRISLERVTFTGTASGATVTPAARVRTTVAGISADAAAVASVRTASTGLTLTAGQVARAWLLPALVTAVGNYGGQFVWDPDADDDELVLAAGEGIVLRQPDAGGATTESRRLTASLVWEEFTAP